MVLFHQEESLIPVTLRPSMIQAFASGEGKPLDDYYERLRRQILGEIIRPDTGLRNPADSTFVDTSNLILPKVKTKIPVAVWIVAGVAVAWIFLKGRPK